MGTKRSISPRETQVLFEELTGALLVGGLLAGLYFSQGWQLIHDAPIQHYIAWRIENGAVPYRDIFDMNMPGVYLLHMLCLALFGGGGLAFHLFDMAFTATGCAAIAAIAWKWGKRYALLGGLLFAVSHIAGGFLHIGQRDFLMAPFLLWSCYFFMRFWQVQRTHLLFWFGLLAGIACWIKPVAALWGIACMLWLLAAFPATWRVKLTLCIAVLFALLLPTLAILYWLHETGALPYFWDIFLGFTLPVYSTLGQRNPGLLPLGLIVLSALFLPLYVLRHSRRRECVMLAIGIAYGYAHYWLQGKGWSYHYYPLLGFFSLYFAFILAHLGALPMVLRGVAIVGATLSAIACFNLSMQLATPSPKNYAYFDEAYEAEMNHIVGSVFPAGSKTDIAFFDFTYAGLWKFAYEKQWITPLRHAYPFGYYASLNPHPSFAQMQEELLGQLEQHLPTLILVSKETWPYEEGGIYRIIESTSPWQEFFSTHYQLLKETGRYRAYVKINGSMKG